MKKRILLRRGAAVVVLAAVLLGGLILARTARYESAEPGVEPAPAVALPEGAVERLRGSLRIPTISHEDPGAFDGEAFRALHTYLQTAFPKVHSQLRRETVATHSLLYTWQGSDPTREPILLMGHPGRFSAEPSALSNIFRFLPVRLGPRDLARMHGTNERIAVRVYEEAVRLYRQLIREAT